MGNYTVGSKEGKVIGATLTIAEILSGKGS